MNTKRKISLMLVLADVLIIVMVVVIKSNSTVQVKAKNTVAAANVLVKSDDALDTYKDNEIEEYITEKKEEERIRVEEEKKKEEEAAQALAEQSRVIANNAAIDANQNNMPNAPIPDTSYSDVASYAVQFVGNPYVYGGTSLTDGADCSGFVQSVYSNFGVSLPRTAYAQSTVGYSVPVDQIQAGDIISYGYNGNVSHSALYIGDNTIVHASTPALGIRTDSMYIMPIVSVRRVSE
jgi:cell wall-associated NlpC family hydrolase